MPYPPAVLEPHVWRQKISLAEKGISPPRYLSHQTLFLVEETSLEESKAPRHPFTPPRQCLLPFPRLFLSRRKRCARARRARSSARPCRGARTAPTPARRCSPTEPAPPPEVPGTAGGFPPQLSGSRSEPRAPLLPHARRRSPRARRPAPRTSRRPHRPLKGAPRRHPQRPNRADSPGPAALHPGLPA